MIDYNLITFYIIYGPLFNTLGSLSSKNLAIYYLFAYPSILSIVLSQSIRVIPLKLFM